MPSAAETLLDAGFAALKAVAGEPMVFPDLTTVSCVVNRSLDRTVNGVPLETAIEVDAASVVTVPSVGATILDGLDIKHCVWRKRQVNSNLQFLCHTFADLPSETAVINGSSFTCFVVDSVDGTDLGLGGFKNEDIHRLAINRRLILSVFMPVEGQSASFRGKEYSVIRVNRNDSGACVLIDIAARVSSQQS